MVHRAVIASAGLRQLLESDSHLANCKMCFVVFVEGVSVKFESFQRQLELLLASTAAARIGSVERQGRRTIAPPNPCVYNLPTTLIFRSKHPLS